MQHRGHAGNLAGQQNLDLPQDRAWRTIYDFDMQEQRRESLERAKKLKAELGDEPIMGTDDRIAYRFVKRVFDFAFSAAVLVLLSWLFVIIAILVKVDDPKGPVLFKQTRVGKNGREFEMLKFRSMCVDAEEKLADLKELNEKTGPVFKIAEDPRITRIGKWLRKLSLDELPQFINVLRSDMSAVGPRPTADIPLPMLARHPDRCSDRLGAPERARLYSVSIHPPACRRAFRQAGRPVVEETTVSLGVVPLCL